MDKEKSLVSVIIVTLNREDVLLDTIKRAKKLSYEPKEIIVIDQNDRVLSQKIASNCRREGIVYAHMDTKGTTPARNKGVKMAKGEFICFFDDDVEILTPNYIEIVIDDLNDTSIGAVTARVHQQSDVPLESITEIGVFNPLTGYALANWNYDKRLPVQNVAGCAFTVRKADLERVGSFNTLFRYNYYFEETEVAIRLMKMGYSILFDPKVEINHLQAQGGARINDEFSLKFAYCYNYAILLLCNYGVKAFLVFFAREDIKRIASYLLKGLSSSKRKMLASAWKGTVLALLNTASNISYVLARRKLVRI